ncbi:SAM pointed domain-containing Ets transcription factor-like isoform X1 [Macrosteles quadrilineatus]|uniref:SAM pointed domain-containing Ets transcription factor-like isoform X1 n=2 Tax=Macrosteles quadrilineatus TaxID=74068 RepID=UPI0023E2A70C|nr:SAM pointed domain-containing Ets transcription factor-like isoform X1 [Macrosteles quadrilineatus]
MTEAMETMPQTVPSVYDYSTSFAADFDLSLLPCDGEVPSQQQQFLSFYYDTLSPPPMFPSPTGEKDDFLLKSIKEEFPGSVDVGYQSWESSPTHSTYSSPVYCPSASPQPEPLFKVKQEITINLEEILQESKYLQEICFPEKKKDSIIRNILENNDFKQEKKESDHRLLREVLKDTSFQRKYNLKPFDIGGLGTAFKADVKMETNGEEVQGSQAPQGSGAPEGAVCGVDIAQDRIEPMLSLAIEQLKEDLNKTCTVLGIAMDPAQWTVEDVKAWLVYNLQQFNLPMTVVDYFNMTGSTLAQLTEEEFQQRAPQGGSLLHAQLEIWKAACIQGPSVDVQGLLETSTQSSSSCGDASEDEEDDDIADSPQPSSSSPKGRGGSHIHLWQFLKELLANPQANGACIRWLDRTNGVFKIEDSVRVARLWGKRKNRPAMNYDKLSRSIRQYYKKGIMKKTERSQRLVYQFCHPYSL